MMSEGGIDRQADAHRNLNAQEGEASMSNTAKRADIYTRMTWRIIADLESTHKRPALWAGPPCSNWE